MSFNTYGRSDAPTLQTLEVGQIEDLRLGWWSRMDASQVLRTLQQSPGLSVWVPEQSEYILIGNWRHRSEIVHVLELVAIRNPVELTVAAIERARNSEKRLFLAVEMSERRQSTFYDQAGLTHLEDVLSFELIPGKGELLWSSRGAVEQVQSLDDEVLAKLTSIDWAAFPWLWRNSESEFRDYLAQTGVEVHILNVRGRAIGYVGITGFPGWGHIDRIALLPEYQSQGFGRELMQLAIARLVALGSTRIGLSTQRRNQRSQRLYASLGFRRQESSDYRIFGCALNPGDDLYALVSGNT